MIIDSLWKKFQRLFCCRYFVLSQFSLHLKTQSVIMRHYPSISKAFLGVVFILNLSSALTAQDFTKDYTPITSSGTLPDEFIRTARSMSEADMKMGLSSVTKIFPAL